MAKIKKQLDLIFPQELIREPVICKLSKEYDICFNIRRAKVTETTGELVLEFEGEEAIIEEAMGYLKSKGIQINPVTGDIVE